MLITTTATTTPFSTGGTFSQKPTFDGSFTKPASTGSLGAAGIVSETPSFSGSQQQKPTTTPASACLFTAKPFFGEALPSTNPATSVFGGMPRAAGRIIRRISRNKPQFGALSTAQGTDLNKPVATDAKDIKGDVPADASYLGKILFGKDSSSGQKSKQENRKEEEISHAGGFTFSGEHIGHLLPLFNMIYYM